MAKKGDKLTHSEIAGSYQVYHKANAVIDGSTVLVYSDNVPKPVTVRFGWSIVEKPYLFNEEGLLTAPFRTDKWEY